MNIYKALSYFNYSDIVCHCQARSDTYITMSSWGRSELLKQIPLIILWFLGQGFGRCKWFGSLPDVNLTSKNDINYVKTKISPEIFGPQ